ncbi:hypothetical protein GCM10028895_13470 [Pontibacter rugosus]
MSFVKLSNHMRKSTWKNIASLAIVVVLALPAQAQTQDPATAYSNGKVLLQQQRYDLAMAELKPLTQNGNYGPEASYFYALAALKSNKVDDAYRTLLQLQNQFASWDGMADADYLLANVLFEQGEYERAISKLQEIQGSALATDAEGLIRYYLTRLNDRPKYEQLLKRFNSDKTVAQVFADKAGGRMVPRARSPDIRATCTAV